MKVDVSMPLYLLFWLVTQGKNYLQKIHVRKKRFIMYSVRKAD